MANKLELIENYVVFSDTATGDNLGEYAVNHCVYTEETDRFEIKEVIDNGRLTITKADLLAEKWVDGSLVVYTEATMRDFLRANTGFKAASGGSGAGSGYEFVNNVVVNDGDIGQLLNTPIVLTPVFITPSIIDFKIIMRFVSGTGVYVGQGQDLIIANSNPYATIPTSSVISINSAIIEELKDGGAVIYGNHSADLAGFEQITPQPTENALLLTTNGLGNFILPQLPLVGGTLYIDVYYNVIPIS